MSLDDPASESGWRRFECADGSSRKFWEVRLDGSTLRVRWGKLGTEGRRKDEDWLSRTRAEKAAEKLVTEKLAKGYVEVSGRPAAAPAAVKPKAPKANAKLQKTATKPKPEQPHAKGAPKTYDDLRKVVFALVRSGRHWPDELIAFLVHWAEDARDEQVMAWLEELAPPERGWFSQAAGRLAVARALSGKADAARRFLKAGEEALPIGEKSDRARATLGLMAAWFRLGEKAKAERAWEELPADRESYVSSEDLGWVAALGGQVDRFAEVGEIGRMFDYATVEGLLALHADGTEVLCDAIDRCETKDESEELAVALLRRALKDGTPGAFVELALRHPDILIGRGMGEGCVTVALGALAQAQPAEALKFARRVLDEEPFSFGYGAHPHAFAFVAAHAPKEAARWAEGREEMGDPEIEERYAYLAALGQTAEVRAALPEINDNGVLPKIACSTPDRALSVEALRAYVSHRGAKLSNLSESALRMLCDLGERALVDALLERELSRLEAEPRKDRDLSCRRLCKLAAVVGRFDLAREAYELPTKGVRYCSAQEIVRGCASVGDFAGTLAALELFDEDDRRRDAAIMSLRVAEAAFATGPRAISCRALSDV